MSWDVTVPHAIVHGTYRAHISINGDIMGKTVEVRIIYIYWLSKNEHPVRIINLTNEYIYVA